MIIFHCKRINTLSIFITLLFLNKSSDKKNNEPVIIDNLYQEAVKRSKNLKYSPGELILMGQILEDSVFLLERRKYKDIVLKALSGYCLILGVHQREPYYFNISNYYNLYFYFADRLSALGIVKLSKMYFDKGLALVKDNLEEDFKLFLHCLIAEKTER